MEKRENGGRRGMSFFVENGILHREEEMVQSAAEEVKCEVVISGKDEIAEKKRINRIEQEELKQRVRAMTSDELDIVLENIPVQYIASHLCCRVNLMQFRLDKMKNFIEAGSENW